MKKLGILLLIVFTLTISFAQETKEYNDDAVLMTIGGKEITKGEFIRIYHKNNNSTEQKSVTEYLELFENFKLKVIEAENLGLDTLPTFRRELDGYTRQLEKPYFTDSLIDEKLKQEAIDRSKFDVRAKHILIKVSSDAVPSDTLKAYNKITMIYNKIKAGENFDTLAKEYSDDKYSAVNGGDLGYFTVFGMVYPFESAAYNTEIGKTSNIFRTQFGYHILMTTDKRPAHGEVKVAHIMIAVPNNADDKTKKDAETKINDIYKKLQAGEEFAKLAEEFSDDKGSAKKGGELNWFGTGRMVPEFESAAFSLKNKNDYTKPIKTSFGWHIIKLIDKKDAKSLEEQQEYVLSKISKDARMNQSKEAVLKRLKKEYNYKAYTKRLTPFFKYFDEQSKEKYEWTNPELETLKAPLIELGDTVFTQADFLIYMRRFTRKKLTKTPDLYVFNAFKTFSDNEIIKYERSKLTSKYPDYKYLLKEYHDGILLFNLTDQVVWSKAVKDTVGLQEYYQKHKEKFMWGERLNITDYTIPTKYYKKAIKIVNKGLNAADALVELKQLAKKDTSAIFIVEDKKITKSDNEKVFAAKKEKGIVEISKNDETVNLVYIKNKIAPEPKELDKVKGLMTADYQNYLEKEWIKELKAKYKIEVNQDVLNSIK